MPPIGRDRRRRPRLALAGLGVEGVAAARRGRRRRRSRAPAGDDDDPHVVVGVGRVEGVDQLALHHGPVKAFSWSGRSRVMVEDAVGDLVADLLVVHGSRVYQPGGPPVAMVRPAQTQMIRSDPRKGTQGT